MKTILSMCLLAFSFVSFAQELVYVNLLNQYNDNLKELKENLPIKDSGIASGIMSQNKFLYSKLVLSDSATAKEFVLIQNLVLDTLNEQLQSPELSQGYKLEMVNAYRYDLAWFRSEYTNAPKSTQDNCPSCFLSRKVEVTVLERKEHGLDTLKCISVTYEKVSLAKVPIFKGDAVSKPCPEAGFIVSTGPGYLFRLRYGGQDYSYKRDVSMGRSRDDVLRVSLVIGE